MKSFQKNPFLYEREELIDSFNKFLEIYENRPFKRNFGGMQLAHCFAIYIFLKKVKPSLVVESGVLRGQGTWLIENICPTSEIICIDIYPHKRLYTSKKAKYYSKDFKYLDWTSIPENSLAFFDDHQNAVDRLIYAKWCGFKHLIFEDNYSDKQNCDAYSLKRAFSNSGFTNKYYKAPIKEYFRKLFSSFKMETKKLSYRLYPKLAQKLFNNPYYYYDLDKLKDVIPNNIDGKLIDKNIEIYHEFPPLIKDINTKNETDEPIFSSLDDLLQHCTEKTILDIKNDYTEASSYNWICYVKLK